MRDLTGLAAGADTHVAGTATRVWELVSDIWLPTRFSDEVRSVRWADGVAGPARGARFVAENHHPAIGSWRSVCEVVAYDPPREFAWAVLRYEGSAFPAESPAVEAPITVWRFGITPAGAGVRLRHGFEVVSDRSGLQQLLERHPEHAETMLAGRVEALRAGIARALREVKELAETAA